MRSAGLRVAAAVCSALAIGSCGRGDRTTPAELRVRIAALEKERDRLRPRLDELVGRDPRLMGMPATPVRVAVPTELARELVEKLTVGFVGQVQLELRNLQVRKQGTVRRIVTIGTYALDVDIETVSGRLETSRPDVRFGGNEVAVALPVSVASGSGRARIRFKWDGRNISDAACGDLEVERVVTGRVRPNRYPVRGKLVLGATAERIVATPRFPPLRVKLEIEPSRESWAAVQQILDSKTGLCGFALDRIDVLGIVRGIVQKGFEVRLPTERIKPMAVPVGIEPAMTVNGRTIALAIRIGGLSITPHALWLGADVAVQPPPVAR